jgi:hypothetical protein
MGLKVGVLAVGLLAVAVPAMAQGGLVLGVGNAAGIGDPLSLATSGVLLPYVNNGVNGDVSLVEVANPAPFNLPIPDLHMVFFNANCNRIVSANTPVTENDILILPLTPIVGNVDGLVAIARAAANGVDLVPLTAVDAIHTRTYWINALSAQFRSRVLSPIVLDVFAGGNELASPVNFGGGAATQGLNCAANAGAPNPNRLGPCISTIWSPLRTGFTFFAPLEAGGVHTVLYLICPKATIQDANNTKGVFPWNLFPRLDTTVTAAPAIAFRTSYPNGSLRGRVYDHDEVFLRDVLTDCDCWLPKGVLSINPIYGNALEAPFGTYTEMETDNTTNFASGDFAMTAYKSINLNLGGSLLFDLFGRVSGGSRFDLGNGVNVLVNQSPGNR